MAKRFTFDDYENEHNTQSAPKHSAGYNDNIQKHETEEDNGKNVTINVSGPAKSATTSAYGSRSRSSNKAKKATNTIGKAGGSLLKSEIGRAHV